jgi:hypothetical protein
LAQAEAQVQALKNQVDESNQAATSRQQAARQRAALDRQERLHKALAEREQLLATRTQQKKEKGVKFEAEELRASTTDPEARRMKMPDGGTRPAYNVQFATTTESGIVVGVGVTNVGSDGNQLQPMLEQIEQRYDQRPAQALVDGGFTTLNAVEDAEAKNVAVIGPVKNAEKKLAAGENPFQPHAKDGPGVATWRQRMGMPETQTLYRLRAQTAEWVNAGARNRGLYQVTVRGRQKVLAVALLHALVHNLLRAAALRHAAAAKT